MQTETSTAQRSTKRSAETPIEKIDPSSTRTLPEEGTTNKRQTEMETEQLQRSEASGSAGRGLIGQAPEARQAPIQISSDGEQSLASIEQVVAGEFRKLELDYQKW